MSRCVVCGHSGLVHKDGACSTFGCSCGWLNARVDTPALGEPADERLACPATAGALPAHGGYRTIVADPPWHYERFLSNKGRPGPAERAAGVDRRVELIVQPLPYRSMPLADIEAMPVADMADPQGCNLFLWTTNRYLHDAFHVAEAWGFTYRQMIVWSKPRGSRPPFRAVISPNCAEYLLLCRISGGAPFGELWESNVIEVPRPGGHSAKPELFLDLVESVSPGPYLELFARRARLGWDVWGDEVDSHVTLGEATP